MDRRNTRHTRLVDFDVLHGGGMTRGDKWVTSHGLPGFVILGYLGQ